MTTAAIITAAGRGLRAGGALPKQWQLLAGKPVLAHTISAFAGMTCVLTIHPQDRARAEQLRATLPQTELTLVEGGATRAASVRNALIALADKGVTKILIHDGARPLISAALIQRVLRALDHHQAAAPALAVTDALWTAREDRVTGTRDRQGLYRAQTPQGFHFDAILAAHLASETDAADDVEVARAAGIDVQIVTGDEDNLKLTYAADFARAMAILKGR